MSDLLNPDLKRARPRSATFLSADVAIEGRATPVTVRVRNLSSVGMMIECQGKVAEGAAVACLLRGVGEVAGRVAWAVAGRAGIAFDEEIDPGLVRAPEPKSPPVTWRRPQLYQGGRPGLKTRD